MSMQNATTAADAGTSVKKPRFRFLKRVFFFVTIYVGFTFVVQLPDIVQTVIMTAGFVGYFYPKAAAAIQRLRSGGKKAVAGTRRAVTRFSRVAATLADMSDEEFDRRFPAAESSRAQQELPAVQSHPLRPVNPFVPVRFCKPVMTGEAAHAAALAWWEEEDADRMTGMQRIGDLIAAITCDDPSKHTAVLNEHDELALPTGQLVQAELVKIMKANGLDADINADSQIIVFWNQYEDGTEAAQAHTEIK